MAGNHRATGQLRVGADRRRQRHPRAVGRPHYTCAPCPGARQLHSAQPDARMANHRHGPGRGSRRTRSARPRRHHRDRARHPWRRHRRGLWAARLSQPRAGRDRCHLDTHALQPRLIEAPKQRFRWRRPPVHQGADGTGRTRTVRPSDVRTAPSRRSPGPTLAPLHSTLRVTPSCGSTVSPGLSRAMSPAPVAST